jgi:dihydroneopterin aldolase
MPDLIHIEALEIDTHIGVPDEERATAQRLTVTLTLEPMADFQTLGDRIEATLDYAAVCDAVQALAAARPRRLVETLAEEIAAELLARFALRRLTVEIRKFILPQTAYVAVRIERPRL